MADPIFRTVSHGMGGTEPPGWSAWTDSANQSTVARYTYTQLLPNGNVALYGHIGGFGGTYKVGYLELQKKDGTVTGEHSRTHTSVTSWPTSGGGPYRHIERAADEGVCGTSSGDDFNYMAIDGRTSIYAIETTVDTDIEYAAYGGTTPETLFKMPSTWTLPSGSIGMPLNIRGNSTNLSFRRAGFNETGFSYVDHVLGSTQLDGDVTHFFDDNTQWQASDSILYFLTGNSVGGPAQNSIHHYSNDFTLDICMRAQVSATSHGNDDWRSMRYHPLQDVLTLCTCSGTGLSWIAFLNPNPTGASDYRAWYNTPSNQNYLQLSTTTSTALDVARVCEVGPSKFLTAQLQYGDSRLELTLWDSPMDINFDPSTDEIDSQAIQFANGDSTPLPFADYGWDVVADTAGKSIYVMWYSVQRMFIVRFNVDDFGTVTQTFASTGGNVDISHITKPSWTLANSGTDYTNATASIPVYTLGSSQTVNNAGVTSTTAPVTFTEYEH